MYVLWLWMIDFSLEALGEIVVGEPRILNVRCCGVKIEELEGKIDYGKID